MTPRAAALLLLASLALAQAAPQQTVSERKGRARGVGGFG
jgi:hypothetical protein